MNQDEYFKWLKEQFELSPDRTRDDLRALIGSNRSSIRELSVEEIEQTEPSRLKTHLLDVFERLDLDPIEREKVTRLRASEQLLDNDIDWLIELVWRRAGPLYLFAILGRFWQDRSGYKHDEWYLTRASRCWRDAGRPDKAIACLEAVSGGTDERLVAAIHTTRAGAFKDLLNLPAAELEGRKALSINRDDRYANNVMGAIAYLRHEYELGDSYFQTAEGSGQSGAQTRMELRHILESMNWSDKQAFGKHLLGVDPKKNAWVAKAIRRPEPKR